MRCRGSLITLVLFALLAAGCPKGTNDYKLGRRAEALKDYDTALEHYQKALDSDPQNADYLFKAQQLRFDAGQYHIHLGEKAREKGELQLALAEFQKAFAEFFELCQQTLNPNIRVEAVDEMLVQHLLTERLFRTIFKDDDFTRRNVIAAEVEGVIDALTRQAFSRVDFLKSLDQQPT